MNLFSLAKAFPTEEAALEYWIGMRWPNGVRCPLAITIRCTASKPWARLANPASC